MWKIHPNPFIKNHRPILFAHRGDSAHIPENTHQAFEDAYQLNVDSIETDVHMTKDRRFVFFHDPSLERTTNGTGQIADYTLAELKELDAGYKFQLEGSDDFPFRGKGLQILSIDEILPRYPNIRFNIDIKSINPEAPKLLAQKLNKLGVEERVCVGSFHQKQIERFRTYSSSASSAGKNEVVKFLLKSRWWKNRLSNLTESEKTPKTYKEAIENQKQVFGKELPYFSLQIPEKMSIINIVSPYFIEFAHYVGISVHVWTINDASDMKRLLQWGVDGIFTDKPRVLLEMWENIKIIE